MKDKKIECPSPYWAGEVARIWTLPQHAKKVLDPELVTSMALLLQEEVMKALSRDREIGLMTQLDAVVDYLRQDRNPKKAKLAKQLEEISKAWGMLSAEENGE